MRNEAMAAKGRVKGTVPRRPRTIRGLARCVAGLFAGGLVLGAPGLVHAQAAAAPDTGQVERITVTAERRQTVLDTTPAAITALDGGKLADQGVTTIADVVMLAPNVSFTTGQNASQIFIRGIGNVFLLAGGDPGVALYADGAYISDQTSSNVALFDLQRIEVLRGPQGALYGRNATGGAMNLISAPPSYDFQARIGALVGNYGRKETEGFISGPLGGGSTRMRLSFQVKDVDGYTKNPLSGVTSVPVVAGLPVFSGPDRLDDLDSRAVRLQSSSDLPGNGNLRLIAGHYRERDAGPSLPVLIDPLMNSQLLFGALPGADPRVVKSEGSRNRIEVNSLLAAYERPLGSSTFSLTASWRKSGTDHDYDGDATESPTVWTRFLTGSTDRSVDLHLSSEDGARFQWMVGVTALQFDQRQDVRVSAQVPLGFLIPGAPLNIALPGGVDVQLGGNVHTRSTAVYTDVRYALNPSLALLGGLRVNRDTKRADEYLSIAAFGLAGTGAPRDEWTSVPGSVGVEYKLSPETLTYARVSHGFKSGAVNLGSLQADLVKPETVTAVELGLKTEFMQRRGTFSAAVFNSDYKDMQVSQVGTATVILANASRARIRGAEFEVVLRPVPEVTLNATLGLMDPKYTDFVNTDLRNDPTQAVNVRGNQLAQVSKAQANVGAEYNFALGGFKASLRADYAWRGKYFFTEFNTPDAVQSAHGLVNLAAWVRPVTGPWKLYGYVRNATDKEALTSLIIAAPFLGAGRQVTYTRPREVGLGLTWTF